jgi:hypothetical protein
MDQFGYLSVLLSIIVGFSVTQILIGFRGVLLSRARVQMYWPTLAWAVLLLLINVQSWWAMFGMRAVQQWTFPAFGILLTQTITQYMLAALVFPDFSGDKAINLYDHYWQHTRWFFGLLIFLLIVSLAKDLVIAGHMTGRPNLLFHLSFITMSAVAMLTPAEKYHQLFPLLGIALFIAYIITIFTPLR